MTGLARCRPLLGTYVQVALRDALPEAALQAAADAAFAAIEDVERTMSFHRPDSDLSRLNGARAGAVVALAPGLVEVLRFAAELHRLSDGVFDPGVADTLVEWSLLPRHDTGCAVPRHASIGDLEFLDTTHVRLRAPTCIDLGGIAKGHAVDRAIEALAAAGLAQAEVNAGGDLRILGDARPVHVRSPGDPRVLQPLGELGDGALATSATYFSAVAPDVGARSALVDARTRTPLADRRSFSVVAPTCIAADALTKVLAITGALPAECARRWDARGIIL